MADPTIQDLIARIDRLEASLTRVPNIIADPAPDPWGGGPWGGNPWGPLLQGQLAALLRRPPGDPPPFDLSRFNKVVWVRPGVCRARLSRPDTSPAFVAEASETPNPPEEQA